MAVSGGLRVVFLFAVMSHASASADETAGHANPIRRVVTMLQNMQKKVTEEGEREKELYDKFMCYCKTSGGDLQESISAAEDKVSTLPTEIEEAEENLKSTKETLVAAKTDREDAKKVMAEATGMREKEAASYKDLKAEYDANIGAIKKAVTALDKGMASGFLQSGAAQVLRHFLADSSHSQDFAEADREELAQFLAVSKGEASYAPQSGSIVGILKAMGDEMSKSLADATAKEEGSIKNYDELMEAKKKEVAALTKSIEKKTKKVGDMGVQLTQMKADLDDTGKVLVEDKKFLKDLDKTCKTKEADFAVRMKTRGEELTALADTIKILNDDDALELFKKTLPAPAGASFVQVRTSQQAVQALALAAVRRALEKASSVSTVTSPRRVPLDLIALALHARKIDFSKVVKMIDDMVALLKKEQVDDDAKKAYCMKSLDEAEDKQKALSKGVKDAAKAISKATKGLETLADEIEALEAGIKSLDKKVQEATLQRKDENQEYKDLIAADGAAKELLLFAKNRLNKFYNPKLYKPPAKAFAELSSEGGVAESFKLVQVDIHRSAEAPPPPPETYGEYKKKGEESTGVISMIDLLIADLDKEMTEAEAEEKDAQGDYEGMISDSAAARAADGKSITEKEGVKADMEAELEAQKGIKKDTSKELVITLKFINSLHGECDFLLEYYDMRKEARSSEIQSLVDAKAVLSGADLSLMQTDQKGKDPTGFLGRRQ